MVSSDTIRAALVLLLLISTRIWHFYAALAAISIISSFSDPHRESPSVSPSLFAASAPPTP